MGTDHLRKGVRQISLFVINYELQGKTTHGDKRASVKDI